MPLFGFGDIQFNKGASIRKGPLGPLVDNRFKTTTLRYPMDIGNYDKGHYMVIYVRQQQNTQFKGTVVNENSVNDAAEATQQAAANKINAALSGNLGSSVGGELLGKINNGLGQINNITGGSLGGITSAIGKAAGNAVSSVNNLFNQKTSLIGGNSAATQTVIDTSIKKITNKSFIKTTQLTTDAIALYMPDTLAYTYAQSYDNAEMGGELLGKIAAAGVSAKEQMEKTGVLEGAASLGKSAVLGISDAAKGLLGQNTGAVAFQALAGVAKNPMLELIYKSPNFRTFQFDFSFYPRDEREALEVQKIIERLRFHQAPELVQDAQGFLIPPSQFDIKFYYGGVQNPNIPPMTTSVLTNIDVNYAPNGWSAFEVPGENQPSLGRTGMPVAIQVTLQFQETTYLTKQDFNSGRSLGIVKNVNDPSNQEPDQ